MIGRSSSLGLGILLLTRHYEQVESPRPDVGPSRSVEQRHVREALPARPPMLLQPFMIATRTRERHPENVPKPSAVSPPILRHPAGSVTEASTVQSQNASPLIAVTPLGSTTTVTSLAFRNSVVVGSRVQRSGTWRMPFVSPFGFVHQPLSGRKPSGAGASSISRARAHVAETSTAHHGLNPLMGTASNASARCREGRNAGEDLSFSNLSPREQPSEVLEPVEVAGDRRQVERLFSLVRNPLPAHWNQLEVARRKRHLQRLPRRPRPVELEQAVRDVNRGRSHRATSPNSSQLVSDKPSPGTPAKHNIPIVLFISGLSLYTYCLKG